MSVKIIESTKRKTSDNVYGILDKIKSVSNDAREYLYANNCYSVTYAVMKDNTIELGDPVLFYSNSYDEYASEIERRSSGNNNIMFYTVYNRDVIVPIL